MTTENPQAFNREAFIHFFKEEGQHYMYYYFSLKENILSLMVIKESDNKK